MRWARGEVEFRRQSFDDERPQPRPQAKPILRQHKDPRPVDRIIVIPATPAILADLMQRRCAVKPVGDDWHIEARDRAAFEQILGYLKVHRIHGVLKRRMTDAAFDLAKTGERNTPKPPSAKPYTRSRYWNRSRIG